MSPPKAPDLGDDLLDDLFDAPAPVVAAKAPVAPPPPTLDLDDGWGDLDDVAPSAPAAPIAPSKPKK